MFSAFAVLKDQNNAIDAHAIVVVVVKKSTEKKILDFS
jgi:hypothetical protein